MNLLNRQAEKQNIETKKKKKLKTDFIIVNVYG